MKRRLFFLTCFALARAVTFGAGDHKAPALTPVDTVRAFFNAMADSDATKIKALALPNPKLKTLYASKPTAEEQEALRKAAQDDLRVLRPGEKVPMNDGVMAIPPPSNNLVFVHGPLMSFPFPVSRVDGVWKVNAAPLLSAGGPVTGTKK